MNKIIKRKFIFGEKWLYYKIYTGIKISDNILIDIFNTEIETMVQQNLIDKWFFVRYADPHHHLRLRFHVVDTCNLLKVIGRLTSYFSQCIDDDLVWKLQLDTYERELERYGQNSIEIFEELFYHDSNMIVKLLDLIDGNDEEEYRWLFALKLIDTILDLFKININNKLDLLFLLKTNFSHEFQIDKNVRLQLNNKYRKKRIDIEKIMSIEEINDPSYTDAAEILNNYRERSVTIIAKLIDIKNTGELEMPIEELLCSYIHMSMNRIFKSRNRLHEMVLYDFLHRYYKSNQGKLKHANSKLI